MVKNQGLRGVRGGQFFSPILTQNTCVPKTKFLGLKMKKWNISKNLYLWTFKNIDFQRSYGTFCPGIFPKTVFDKDKSRTMAMHFYISDFYNIVERPGVSPGVRLFCYCILHLISSYCTWKYTCFHLAMLPYHCEKVGGGKLGGKKDWRVIFFWVEKILGVKLGEKARGSWEKVGC